MSSEVQAPIVYEYPLQERFRTYLRLEHSFNQLRSTLGHDHESFFNALFASQELIERSDIRAELSKDLIQQKNFIKQWEKHPQIDQDTLQAALHSVSEAHDGLQHLPKQLRHLKDDRFLASIRTRLVQPGLCGLFELPQLQLWLSHSPEQAWQQCHIWYHSLQPLIDAIALQLQLTRQQGDFTSIVAKGGFWQESCEPLSLIRIQVAVENACYPVISGHRQRFTLRFMTLPGEDDQQSDASSDDIPAAIARCPLL